ncbi:MAG: phosphoglycerate kinase [Patescibacteria group bacterium]
MSFNKKTIEDVDVKNKLVLLRADYNVPIENGHITSDLRIKQSLPTVKYLMEHGAKLVICSHLGRPKGPEKASSLRPVADRLSKLLDKKIAFTESTVGDDVGKLKKDLKPGEALMIENVRFYSGETDNNAQFAKNLAEGIDVFVQDGFGVVHRAHASTEAVPKLIKHRVAGFLLEKEVTKINLAMKNPQKPLVALIGGAKVSDKIELIDKFIEIADVVLIGGAMGNTFLKANGYDVGKSLYEPDMIGEAKRIMDKAHARVDSGDFLFYLPQDAVVSAKMDSRTTTRIVDWSAHAIANIESYPRKPAMITNMLRENEAIYDIGPFSGAFMAGVIQMASTVVWNGTMGVIEVNALHSPIGPFSHGTDLVVQAMTGQFGKKPKVVVGGGDTAGYVENRGISDLFDHVSTGGGACMDLMVGKKLPGVEVLDNKA